MSKTVAIQGEQASFHDIAATRYFGTDIERVSGDTFKDTFEAVASGKADYAVCAIENSLYGSINETYDLLTKHRFSICGEIYLRVDQCLIGLPGANIKDIEEVHSHLVALAQCEDYLDRVLPDAKRFESHDTAVSVKKVKELGDLAIAAIASREAAELHGMEVLSSSIETNQENYTRFIVLAPKSQVAVSANKSSLIIRTSDGPGALYHALGAFEKNSINLTKLQSRPIIGKAWHYIFYVDVEASTNDPRFMQALEELSKQKCEVTVLGSYVAGAKI